MGLPRVTLTRAQTAQRRGGLLYDNGTAAVDFSYDVDPQTFGEA